MISRRGGIQGRIQNFGARGGGAPPARSAEALGAVKYLCMNDFEARGDTGADPEFRSKGGG